MSFSENTKPEIHTSTVLVGSPGPFSASVFRALHAQGIAVSHVVCAGVAPATPVGELLPVSSPTQNDTLDVLASQLHIPITYIPGPSSLLSPELVLPENPDYILVACFPYRIPLSLIKKARIACLNIHPSLLPKYRGPDPIFWQLKKGETQTGVSLHLLTQEFDTGPIVMQKMVAYQEGFYKKDIEILLGNEGAQLFTNLIKDGLSIEKIARNQDATISSYHPGPSESDFQLSTHCSARQAYNFIRGTWPPINQYTVGIDDATWIITQALSYSAEGSLPEPVQKNHNELYIQFSPGILHAHGYEA